MRPREAPENGPAPTPARAVYGFLLFVASVLAAGVYLAWALVPPSWLRALGLDYWPQQLWALTVPTALLAALFLFVLIIYPLLGLLDAPGLSDTRVYTDEFSLSESPTAGGGIPPVYDIPLSEVCRHLYLDGVAPAGQDEWPPPPPSVQSASDSPPQVAPLRDRPRRRQSERPRATDGAWEPAPRLRSASELGARRAERGYGDVRWRVRRRRREDSRDGLSPDADS